MKKFAMILFFVVLLAPPICGGIRAHAAELVTQAQEFEIVPQNGRWDRVLGRGVGVVAINGSGNTTKCNWTAYSPGDGEEVIWFIHCALPEAYLEQIRKTVDADSTDAQPWKTTLSKDGRQTAVHTSYRWAARFCGNERQPNKQCDVRQILDEPIRTLRTFEFVKEWEVKQYLPKQQ